MNYIITHNLNEKLMEELHQLFEREWWTRGRKREDIKNMLAYSDIVMGLCDSHTNELIGFTSCTDRLYL
ncbi:hypothetical protein [Neobacillus dielmonensis]|uniref:hypothetical protein n=1 Tax=Neobacillus dielmonensis TaxID=1347369 RepID=UPI000694586E|nr:hypothetical protein [Neobacillus dielmonensis]